MLLVWLEGVFCCFWAFCLGFLVLFACFFLFFLIGKNSLKYPCFFGVASAAFLPVLIN